MYIFTIVHSMHVTKPTKGERKKRVKKHIEKKRKKKKRKKKE